MPQISFEVGSIILMIIVLLTTIFNWIDGRATARQKAKSGDDLVKKLTTTVDETKKEMGKLNLFCAKRCTKTDGKFEAINHLLHNGITEKLDKIIETNDTVNNNQWKAINENKTGVAVLKSKL